MRKKHIVNGCIYHINFGKTFHPEIKNKHLGIIFKVPSTNNMLLCLPLTSPKPKHFKTPDDFNNRNIHSLKYPHLYYIKDTDSMVLMDQFRTISINRLESQYKHPISKQKVLLSESEKNKIIHAFNKVLKNILK